MLPNTRTTSVTADTQLRAGAGYIEHIVITNVTTGGTLTVYDSLTETGTVIQAVTLAIANTPIYIPVRGAFQTGLYIGFDGTLAGRVTISYV